MYLENLALSVCKAHVFRQIKKFTYWSIALFFCKGLVIKCQAFKCKMLMYFGHSTWTSSQHFNHHSLIKKVLVPCKLFFHLHILCVKRSHQTYPYHWQLSHFLLTLQVMQAALLWTVVVVTFSSWLMPFFFSSSLHLSSDEPGPWRASCMMISRYHRSVKDQNFSQDKQAIKHSNTVSLLTAEYPQAIKLLCNNITWFNIRMTVHAERLVF